MNGLLRAPGHVPLDFLSATERAPRKWSGFVACTAKEKKKKKTVATTSARDGTSRMTKRRPPVHQHRLELLDALEPAWAQREVRSIIM